MKHVNLKLKIYLFNFIVFLIMSNSIVFAQQGWVSLESLPTEYDINSVFFTNSDTGFIIGHKFIDDPGEGTQGKWNSIIGKTTDGGYNWNYSKNYNYVLSDIRFFNSHIGFCIGDSGTILKSINSGESWDLLEFDSTDALTNLWQTNDQIGFIGSEKNYFLKTINGGLTWDVVNTNFKNWWKIGYLCFPTEYIGYALLWGYSIYKTTDGGYKWNEVHNAYTNGYTSLYFINPDTGFAPGCNVFSGRLLLKTFNGLNSWDLSLNLSYTNSYLTDVFFTNDSTGYVIGNQGKIYYTNDYAKFWKEQSTPISSDLSSICFPSPLTGYVVGKGGIILKTSNGGISDINERIICNIDNFTLYQNYPNPFNPNTNIKYSLKTKINVRLIIYDISGKYLKTLINSAQYPGEYIVNFNANDLASGVYIYKLNAGSFVKSRKMLLLR